MKHLYHFFFIILLSIPNIACSEKNQEANNKEPNKISKASYQLKKVKKQIDTDKSPIGYWEIDLAYPQLQGNQFEGINKQIEKLVRKYSCNEDGDKTFNSEVVYSSNKTLSFTYESMWMCATMPNPDSESGAISFDLKSGKIIDFFSLIDKDKFDNLNTLVNQKASELLKNKNSDCAHALKFNLIYPSSDGINFAYTASTDNYECEFQVVFQTDKVREYFIKTLEF